MKKLVLSGLIATSSLIALAAPPKIHESGQPGAPRTPIIAREDPKAPTMPIPAYMMNVFENMRAREGQPQPGKMLAPLPADALDMYGYLFWSNNLANLPGIYLIEDPMNNRIGPDYGYDLYGYKKLNGWYLEYDEAVGGVSINMNLDTGLIYGYGYYRLDLNTGSVTSQDYPLTDFMFQKCTYFPPLDRVYGYLGNPASSQEEYYWAFAPLNKLNETTRINTTPVGFDEYCYALCYSSFDGNFYGVNGRNQFVRIDRNTGKQTLLLDLKTVIDPSLTFDFTYCAGLVWNEGDSRFYFNAPLRNPNFTNSSLSEIMALIPGTDGKYTAESVMKLPDAMTFSFMFTKVDGPMPNQPIAPIPGIADFEDASLTGTVVFYLPDIDGEGESYPDNTQVEWTATLDGDIYKVNGQAVTGTGTPFQEVSVTYTVTEPGIHVFGMYATVNGVQSPSGLKAYYVGNDTPDAPKNVLLSSNGLTWSPVTKGLNGGYVDTDAMEYEVTLNGKVIGKTKETYYNLEKDMPANGELMGYDATVTAICNGFKSAVAESNHIVYGEPYYITEYSPYYIQPTEQQWNQMTTVDANGDKQVYPHLNNWTIKAWVFNENGGYDGGVNEALTIMSSNYNDDYVYLPPVYLDETTNYYKVSFHCAGEGDYFNMFASLSPDPSAKRINIISNYTPISIPSPGVNAYWDYVEAYLHVPEAGVYYIGIQAQGSGNLHINRITVEPSDVNDNSPQALEYLVLSPGANGNNIAMVTMLPSQYKMDGSQFPEGDEIYAKIMVNGKEATFEGKPVPPAKLDPNIKSGESPVSVWVDTEQSGYRDYSYFQLELNKIDVQVYDIIDGKTNWGPVSRGEVYTGYDYPATPTGVTGEVLGNYSTALITWNPVIKGASGGTIDPEGVFYDTFLWQQPQENVVYWLDLLPKGEFIYDTEYTFDLLSVYNHMDDISYADAPQDWYSVGVGSKNVAGSTFKANYVDLLMGKPYDLPYVDDFTNSGSMYGNTTQMWVPISELDGVTRVGSWSRGTLTEGYALLGRCNNSGSGAILIPPFSTKGQDGATLSMSVRTGSNAPSFKLLYEEPLTYKYTEIGSYTAKEGPQEFEMLTFAIPKEYLGKDALKIYIVPTYTSSSEQFWMNYISVTGESGIGSIEAANAISINGTNGGIIVRGAEGEEISVWGIDGVLIKKAKAEGATTIIPASKGVYVVKAGDKKAKVIVR